MMMCKDLTQLEQRSDLKKNKYFNDELLANCDFKQELDQPPFIFWLLTGYFRSDYSRLKSVGLFRETVTEYQMHKLLSHINQGNYTFLNKVSNPHIIANYWKKFLQKLEIPLIPS